MIQRSKMFSNKDVFAKIAQCAKVGGGIGKGKKVGYCVLRRETEKKVFRRV